MATEVVFESGIIGEAVKKARRVAPSRGGAEFDQAAGTILDLDPDGPVQCVIRATDTQTYYVEALSVLSISGDRSRWRLPSALLADAIGAIAPRGNKPVTMQLMDGINRVKVSSGTLRAEMNMILNRDYPTWGIASPSKLTPVVNFGEIIKRVEWAASRSSGPPLCGVQLDGQYAFATDRYRMARYPCKIDLDEKVLIPAFAVGEIISGMGEVLVGFEGTQLIIQPNDYSQFRTLTFPEKFPDGAFRGFTTYENSATVGKKELIELVQQAASFAGADRDPLVQVFLGANEVAVFFSNPEVGSFGDRMATEGADNARIVLKFNPKYLVDCLSNSPHDRVVLKYNASNPRTVLFVTDEQGYEAICAPRFDGVSSGA